MARSEASIQQAIRLAAAGRGLLLWRNNVGMAFDRNGNAIRYGLANDSQKMNNHIKSSDLIGIRPVVITPEMVGNVIGQFVAIEVKTEDWVFKGTPRELAQQKFLDLVASKGAFSSFAVNEKVLGLLLT